MNLVFDKKSLRVISFFNNDLPGSDKHILRSMFPDKSSLGLWRIDDFEITHNPVHLTITFDKRNHPFALLYKGKEIYRCSKKEKGRLKAIDESNQRVELEKAMPKGLMNSISADVMKLWMGFPHTEKKVANALQTFDYFKEAPVMPVSWWGPFTDAGGYANMNREIVFRLHNHHVVTKVDICPTAPQISSLNQYYLSKYAKLNFSHVKAYPRVWAFTPLPHPSHNGKNIFFTMMETETLHSEFVRIINCHSDEVWVPSSHNKRVFTESGVKKPIHIVPLGIDEQLYKNADDREKMGMSELEGLVGKAPSKGIKKFKFLSLFGWSYRKGPDILIKSFVREFSDKDDVALIIVARHSGSSEKAHVDIIREEANRYARSERQTNLPQILLYPHIIPEQNMPSIFSMGDAFIHTSRGEGFSLPQIEAAACGLPVISCNNTGMGEYLRDDNSYMISTNEKEICSPEMHWITSYYQGQLFAKLGDDQIEQARTHMRSVVDDYSEAKQKAGVLKGEVFDKYTWKHAAFRVSERIREIYAAR